MYWNQREARVAHWAGGNLSKIKAAVFEFEAALEKRSESAVQAYLERNPFIFEFLSDDGAGFILSQFRLAEKHVPDFVIFSRDRWSNNPCLRCTLIEIENPGMPLFTRTGNPSSQLTHAIRQVQDWKNWIRNNSQYLQKQLALLLNTQDLLNLQSQTRMTASFLAQAVTVGICYRYMIIGGRRTALQISDLVRLTEMNENMHDIKITTYDAILSGWLNLTHDNTSIFRSWNLVE